VSYVQNYFIKISYFKNLSIRVFLVLFSISSHFYNLLKSVVFHFFYKTLVFNLNKYVFKYVVVFLLIFKKIKKIYNKSLNNQLLNFSLLKSSKNNFFMKQNRQISFLIFNKNYVFLYVLFLIKILTNHNSINLKQQLFIQTWNFQSLFWNIKDSNLTKIFVLI
jgi:hypothetical protein